MLQMCIIQWWCIISWWMTVTASLRSVSSGFYAQVCNSQGGRGRGFIMLKYLILHHFPFLYIGRDLLVHI